MAFLSTNSKLIKTVPQSTVTNYVDEHSRKQILEVQSAGLANKQPMLVSKKIRDWVTFIDIDYKLDSEPSKAYDSITLPTIPIELEYTSETNLQAVASFGRNTPFYQYTGGEDSLNFNIDFYSRNSAKDDVIYWCRWLEAMSKPDGYKGGMHRVILVWGKDDLLFGGDNWFISKANYKLSQFQTNKSLLPAQATMELSLVRVVDHNRTTTDMFGKFTSINTKP